MIGASKAMIKIVVLAVLDGKRNLLPLGGKDPS